VDELASYLPIEVKYWDKEVGPGVSVEVMDVYFVDTNGQKHSLVSDALHGYFSSLPNKNHLIQYTYKIINQFLQE